MPRIYKVAVSIPTEGHTGPEALDPLLVMAMNLGKLETKTKMENAPVQFEFYWHSAGRLFTPMAREKLVEQAMKGEMDYVFFLDDDAIVPFDAFLRLFKHNKDIVAGLAFTRNPPHDPVLYILREGYEDGKEYFQTWPVRNFPENALVQADAVGFHCVLIKTEVFKKIPRPWFMSTSPTGEDILFCLEAGKHGAKIFMDTSLECGHVGAPHIIAKKDFERYNPPEKRIKEAEYHKYPITEENLEKVS